jgi:hypothetical protein
MATDEDSDFDKLLHEDALDIITDFIPKEELPALRRVNKKLKGVITRKLQDTQTFVDKFESKLVTVESILAHVKILAAINPTYAGIKAKKSSIDTGLQDALTRAWSLQSVLCAIYPANRISSRRIGLYTNAPAVFASGLEEERDAPAEWQDGFLVAKKEFGVDTSLLCLKPILKSQSIDLVYTRTIKGDTIEIGVNLCNYDLTERNFLVQDSTWLNNVDATGPFSEEVKTHSGWTDAADAPALAALLHKTALFADPPDTGVWKRVFFAKRILEGVLIAERQTGMYTVRDACV